MSEHWPDGGEEPDLTTIAHDDLLLDVLGGGGGWEADADGLTAMLAAWRADLTADEENTDVTGAHGLHSRTAVHHPVDQVGADTTSGHFPASAPSRPFTRRALRLAAAVAAALVLLTALGVGSRNAGPNSPLWPLTKVLHPERADVRDTERTIARARAAVEARRFEEARQLIDQAQQDLTRITDVAAAARLRADIDAVLHDLTVQAGCPTLPRCATIPTPSPVTSTASPHATRSRAPRTTTSAPRPAASAPSSNSRSKPLPSAPELPLPPAPAPSVLLPLPTGDLVES
ncbi:hypothetical protein GCE86_09605 [Micromonospora terminaliae]|uniref:Anti-sigma-D factor RsdA sigma factor binding region domain-containing protein n=1 Tax=Micromonospora terminaliae TaxID=1914461 RepID=A0AAJ2ZER8_9ACTN|nr:hypothetical protein [Micromonospora terminaliae]NES27969.1 hypothetical protein [Micromonospora terminaliae]QGL47268.1 hypothetical protein GCE86_09605 [Micromonospora terminaliae]